MGDIFLAWIIYWSPIHVTYVLRIFRSTGTSVRIVRHHCARLYIWIGSRIITASCQKAATFMSLRPRDRGETNWIVNLLSSRKRRLRVRDCATIHNARRAMRQLATTSDNWRQLMTVKTVAIIDLCRPLDAIWCNSLQSIAGRNLRAVSWKIFKQLSNFLVAHVIISITNCSDLRNGRFDYPYSIVRAFAI